eukprot:1609242-Prymnesium_polylepis.1
MVEHGSPRCAHCRAVAVRRRFHRRTARVRRALLRHPTTARKRGVGRGWGRLRAWGRLLGMARAAGCPMQPK